MLKNLQARKAASAANMELKQTNEGQSQYQGTQSSQVEPVLGQHLLGDVAGAVDGTLHLLPDPPAVEVTEVIHGPNSVYPRQPGHFGMAARQLQRPLACWPCTGVLLV